MRIIELNFKNINSLKGEHRISFEEVPLSNASIFAIVGPTGSGKSTILDVITLALFNRIPRFSKAISTKGITKEASIITHHTKEASASIEYEIKGERYKSKWSIQTNRNDNLKDYEMTFYNPDGTVADLKKSEIPTKNEEIIGLNYDQFVKSILLSQGEFSKFLRSDKNARGALLENLTGTSIYRKIGRKTYEKYKSVKEGLEQEKALLGEHQTLDEEETTRLQSEIKTSTEAKTNIDKGLEDLNNLLQIKQSVQKLSEDLVSKNAELTQITNLAKAFQSDEVKIKTHQKLSHLQGSYTTYKNAKTNVVQSKANVIRYQSDLENNKTQLQSTISEMATLTKREVNQDNFKKEMSAFEKLVNDLDNDLRHLLRRGQEGRERVNQEKQSYPIAIGENINPSEALTLLSQREAKLSTAISKSIDSSDQTIEELKTGLKKLQQEVELLKVIEQHYHEIKKLSHKIATQKVELKKHEDTIHILLPLIDKNKELLESSIKHISLLRKQKEDALKIAELEELREALVSGEECPLCGSIEHPYTNHLPDRGQSQINIQIEEVEINAKAHQAELTTYLKELNTSKAIVEQTQKGISESIEELTREENSRETLSKELPDASWINPENIKQIIDEKATLLIEVEQAIDAISELEFNDRLSKQYIELSKIGEQYQSLKSKRQEKYSGTNVSIEANRLQDAFQDHLSNIIGLESVIMTETQSLHRDEELVLQLAKELEPKIKNAGLSNIDEMEKHLLGESTLQILSKRKEEINNTNVRVNTEITNLNNTLKQKALLDTDQQLSIEVLQYRIGEQKTLSEQHHKTAVTNQEKLNRDSADRKRFKVRQQNIDKLNKEFGKWSLLNKLIGDATGNTFANFAQGLTMKNLLVYANRRLENLSDRYLLSKPEDDGALTIVDKYQGNTIRSVKTLSGGETFLISLALALSLSDMASKNVALGCLFIDEGFGTLDPETLELAMTTLETLQSESQKTVGVISHVATLKERITTQIQLDRNAQGLSSIEIVG